MFASLAKALGAGLSLWEHKEANKYRDKLMQLKKDYREEYSKPLTERSDAVLDGLEFELRVLCDSFASTVGGPDSTN